MGAAVRTFYALFVLRCVTAQGQQRVADLDLYDCLEKHTDQWTVTQRNWCCQNRKRGCDVEATSSPVQTEKPDFPEPATFNLVRLQTDQAVVHNNADSSKAVKFDLPVNRLSFDCAVGYHSWRSTWSTEKRSWCCVYVGQGCEGASPTRVQSERIDALLDTTTSAPFDCLAGLTQWKREWSVIKKTWCCEHRKLGCALDDEQVAVAVEMGATATATEPQASADHSTTAAAFNCVVSSSSHVNDWAVGKRAWCCEHAQQGCRKSYSDAAPVSEGATTTNPAATKMTFDCMNDYQNWRWSWTDAKRTWCCKNKGLGCEQDDVEASANVGVYHDCKASPTNLRSAWSDEKQQWCCKNQGVACDAVNPTTMTGGHVAHIEKHGSEKQFDCMMELANFKTKWPEDKKVWCCETKSIGCSVKYHKGHRVWFSRRYEVQAVESLNLQRMRSHVQVLVGAVAACMLVVGAVLGFRRRNDASVGHHPSYANFLSGGSDLLEAKSTASA